jgi:hypothetical protein
MSFLSIRDLQKISGETIGALEGPTPVKAGERTIGVLIPLKVGDADKLMSVLKRAERLAKKRDPKQDERLLAEFGEVDPVNWSVAAVKKLRSEVF